MEPSEVIAYKCPCCGTGLPFGSDSQQMTCEYCDTTFEGEAVQALNECKKTILLKSRFLGSMRKMLAMEERIWYIASFGEAMAVFSTIVWIC